ISKIHFYFKILHDFIFDYFIDILRFKNRTEVNSKQIIPADYIKKSITPAHYLTDSKTHKAVDFYGYQWWIMNYNGKQVPYARGILGQYIFIIPEDNAIIVRLGHKRSRNYINHHPTDTYSYLNTAERILNARK
ncbi:hypothetical protein OM075_16085, partial [Marinilabiliaceae bacterium AAT]|nr:hypothetical protein [Plebeiobacterium sediminum]